MTTNPLKLKEKILDSLADTANVVYERMLAKKEQYTTSMKKLSIFKERKYYIEAKLRHSDSPELRAQYASILSLCSNSEIDSDILRSSLQDSISYSGKVSNFAFFANEYLA